jgi:hypothetical protein
METGFLNEKPNIPHILPFLVGDVLPMLGIDLCRVSLAAV